MRTVYTYSTLLKTYTMAMMQQFYRTNRPGIDDVDAKKSYTVKKVRQYVGPRQRTVPRIPYAKLKHSKRGPGPATYTSTPNTFGKQFRVGNGRSATAVSFGTAQRFKTSHSTTFVGILKKLEREGGRRKPYSPYLRSARPSTAGNRRKRRKNKGKQPGSGEVRTPKQRPGSAPSLSRSASSLLPPGPMCYVHTDAGIGKQTVSARKTSPAVQFSKAKRDINLNSFVAGKGDLPENTPGSADYRTSRSLRKLSAHRPNCNFGTSPRFDYHM